MRGFKHALGLGVALVALGAVTTRAEPAAARGPTPTMLRPAPMVQPLVSVALVDGHGAPLRSAMQDGRTFVAGERGERYAVEISNNTGRRLEVVVSVDGRDVVSGKSGDFRTQRGYVIGPFQTVTIDGFRQSLQQVAAFRFSSVAHSYAARRGSARNVGVIGVAVFEEQARPMMKRSAKSAPAPSAPSAGATTRQELGTEYGESRMSAVREVRFVRAMAERPSFRTALFYDSHAGLAARGIMLPPAPIELAEPDPFPAFDDRFAPPP